tara:strand:+ start:3062 stop:3394 length:333 start_codon:yes stop_codon:yes gene_type:complete
MSRLELILSAIATLSILINIGLFIYARNVVSKLFFVSNELYDLGNMVDVFTNHLESIYEMEMFYGDETLGGLIEHARSFNEQMETFEFIYNYADAEADNNTETTIDDKTD